MNKKLLAVIFGAGLMLAACGGEKEVKPEDTTSNGDTTETATLDAEKIVNAKCISCHGNNLEGRGNFPALDDIGARMTQEEILDVIENGQGRMPGKIISGEDAQAVAEWLSAKK